MNKPSSSGRRARLFGTVEGGRAKTPGRNYSVVSCSKASTLRDFASLFFLLLLVYFSFFFLLRLLWWCWLTPMLSCTWLTGWHVNHHKYPKHKLPVADAQRLWRKKSVDDSSLSPFHLRNKARENSLDAIIPVLELFFLFLFPLPVFPGQWETVLRVFCREKRLGEQLAGGWNHQTYKSYRNDITAISFFSTDSYVLLLSVDEGAKKQLVVSCPIGKWIVFFRLFVHQWVSDTSSL